MRPRSVTATYQTAARAWLTAAVVSFALPAPWRWGLWLPLHLVLAGAISSAISGAMQNFMLALTSTQSPPAWLVRSQFLLLTGGTGMIAIGVPSTTTWLTGAGGFAFVGSMAILGWMLHRAWRRSLNRRHGMPIAAYAAAIVSVLIGATLGALIGSRGVGGAWYLPLKHAHMTMNVLGWASFTVVGTLVTLLPTVLRMRIPRWPGRAVLSLLLAGLSVQLLGWILGATPVLAVGGLTYLVGALGLLSFVASVLRTRRRRMLPIAGMHMMGAVAWFVVGSLGLAIALIEGPGGFDRYRSTFLVAFVGGWLVQVLFGAWSYLLPTATPGHPDQRRRSLSAFELLGRVQVASLNAGLILVAAGGAGWVGAGLTQVGVVALAAGGGIALVKAWAFTQLARRVELSDRASSAWRS